MSEKLSGLDGLKIRADTPARMEVINPFTKMPLIRLDSDEQDSAWVDVLSDTSSVGSVVLREQTDKIFQRRGRVIRADDVEKDLVEKAARLTVGWSLLTLAGEPIELAFTRANAREIFAIPELKWLRDQVLEFSADLGNFQKTS
jgi:hypothetical protein